jgi:hypothetical protein
VIDHLWLFFVCLLAVAAPSAAQSPAATTPSTAAPSSTAPPLRRWFEIQSFTASTRYRFIESNSDVVSSNDLQYKEAFRARVNADAQHRYTLNIGVFSGSGFTSSWDNTGLGISDGDYHSHYVKQLYGAAIPVPGLEVQAGGLYVVRGETTEYTSYDEDSYLVGERVSVRRPREIFLDEVTVTRGMLGTTSTPNLFKRWDGFSHPNYTQVLTTKRFSPMVAGSLDYSTQAGADTIRAAVSLRFKASAPLQGLRYEMYRRVNAHPAGGFVLTAERTVSKQLRLQGGYATVDERYGNVNADRIQHGRRVFAVANIALAGPLSASLFATQALDAPYAISNRTRFDAILQYDVLAALKKTGKF